MSDWLQRTFTAQDFLPKEDDDCYLDPTDPVHQYMGVPKLAVPQITINKNNGSEKARIMREQNIKPGTEAWFKLWFGKQ
jgi:hypothetical protein